MSTMQSVIERFIDYYAELESQPPTALTALYHPDAVLCDPFGEHKGFLAIHRYLNHLLTNVEQCRFSIDPPLCGDQRFAVTWTMHWSHPNIGGREALELPGCSVVEVQGDKVLYQRDYYDAGEMLYEHLPVLGWAVRGVKRRVRA